MHHSEGGIRRHDLAFESFGVRVRVTSDSAEALDRIPEVLPPGWQRCGGDPVHSTFSLSSRPGGKFELASNRRVLVDEWQLDVALIVLERELRMLIALEAPGLIFVHAGAVAYRGRAIVIPGKTHSGKTTLVAAMVRSGAEYYSDEYAVLDENGLLHPFAKPLSLRERQQQTDHTADALGGAAGTTPVSVGMFLITRYRPNADWRPTPLTPGEAVIALLEDTVAGQTRPDEALRTLSRAVGEAVVLRGERPEAATLAPLLLADLQSRDAERRSGGRLGRRTEGDPV